MMYASSARSLRALVATCALALAGTLVAAPASAQRASGHGTAVHHSHPSRHPRRLSRADQTYLRRQALLLGDMGAAAALPLPQLHARPVMAVPDELNAAPVA